jgi:N6-L-threonylcarbamoyladenine synthase
VERTTKAAEELKTPTILVSGGVAANRQLRAAFEERSEALGLQSYFPSLALSTDNAAMIAAAAFPRLKNHILADTSLNASASLPLG